MDFPLILTAIVAIIVTIYFAVKGLVSFGGSMDDKAFFLLGGTLIGRHAAASHAAATMSLATTFMFFLSFGKAFGLALLVAPVTLIAGAYLFGTLLLPRLDAQGFFGNDRPSTLAEYVQRRTGSRLLSKCILFATCLTMLSIVLIELFLSVEIFSIFFRESHEGLFRPQDAALVLIMLTAFAYTAFGGLKAVVDTDVIQYRLMMCAMVAFLSWLVVADIQGTPSNITIDTFGSASLPLTEGFLLPYPLLLNMIVINVLFTTCMLRTWLVTAAQPNLREARRGVIGGGWKAAVIATLLMLVGILAFRSRFPTEDAQPTISDLFRQLLSLSPSPGSSDLMSILGAYGILPLFFAACLAAMLSTIDSALLPVLHFLLVDILPRPTGDDIKRPFWHVPVCTLALMSFVIVLYFLLFRWKAVEFQGWLFTLLGFATAAGPVILLVVMLPAHRLCTRRFAAFGTLAVLGAVAIVTAFSYVGNHSGDFHLVLFGSPCAVLFGFGIAALGAISPIEGRKPSSREG